MRSTHAHGTVSVYLLLDRLHRLFPKVRLHLGSITPFDVRSYWKGAAPDLSVPQHPHVIHLDVEVGSEYALPGQLARDLHHLEVVGVGAVSLLGSEDSLLGSITAVDLPG